MHLVFSQDRNYPGRFSQRNFGAPESNIRYPPPQERAPAIPKSDIHHSRTMTSLSLKTETPIQQIPNNPLNRLSFHQNRYLSEVNQLPLNGSASQKVDEVIIQGRETNYNFQIPANSNLIPINVHSNKKPRPDKPNSLPVLNCLFAALNEQKKHDEREVSVSASYYCYLKDFDISFIDLKRKYRAHMYCVSLT